MWKIVRTTDIGTILLTVQEGDFIKKTILDNHLGNMPGYCRKVGLQPANVYSILSGQRRCSIKLLNQLLSATNFEVVCQLSLLFVERQTGENVKDVDLQELEGELQFDETNLPSDGELISFSSEKPLEKPKMHLENPSSENPDESSS